MCRRYTSGFALTQSSVETLFSDPAVSKEARDAMKELMKWLVRGAAWMIELSQRADRDAAHARAQGGTRKALAKEVIALDDEGRVRRGFADRVCEWVAGRLAPIIAGLPERDTDSAANVPSLGDRLEMARSSSPNTTPLYCDALVNACINMEELAYVSRCTLQTLSSAIPQTATKVWPRGGAAVLGCRSLSLSHVCACVRAACGRAGRARWTRWPPR